MHGKEDSVPGEKAGGNSDNTRGNKKGMGIGPGGKCLCPNCGTTWPHLAGRPCYGIICPECGSQMIRQ
jgi:hypothetical protein